MKHFPTIIGTFSIEGDQVHGPRDIEPEEPGGLSDQELRQVRDQMCLYLKELRQANLLETKQAVREAVTQDLDIVQAIRCIDDLTRVIDILGKRLREWYEYHNPEVSWQCIDHEVFVAKVKDHNIQELMTEYGIDPETSMGKVPRHEDEKAIRSMAARIDAITQEKESLKLYMDALMDTVCPNVKAIAGTMLGARLLEHAGSMQELAELPASTIQLLGAEKALFRHIRTGARCPKYGLLLQHPIVAQQHPKLKGKAARAIADKLSIAARVDYYEGDFIGTELREKLEKRFA